MARFVSIWFRHLITDGVTLRHPALRELPFVVSAPSHGRVVITAANALAETQGIGVGMAVADARAVLPSLHVVEDRPGIATKLLHRMAEWCIRFTPVVAIDGTDGLVFDATGCAHLWGGDTCYVTAIARRFKARGYDVRIGMADTIGAAWAVARFGQQALVIEPGKQLDALLSLPPASLRLDGPTVDLLHKLGLCQIGQFIAMPAASLQRRFGNAFLQRLQQALGKEPEWIEPVFPVEPYQERLPCLEPIATATGITIALERLLDTLCSRLQQEQKGIRIVTFKCYRVDGKIEQATIETGRASHRGPHLFKLFEHLLTTIEPALGIELFVLEATKVEDLLPEQQQCWKQAGGLQDTRLSELVDRLASRFGAGTIQRYLPAEHYWPERSIRPAVSLQETSTVQWQQAISRPIQLLSRPEPIQVTAPIPDYPPMNFRYKGILHTIKKADGPERIEQEWWLQQGEHRDYYAVEDQVGRRYWVFRSGHYTSSDQSHQWFIHGFFA